MESCMSNKLQWDCTDCLSEMCIPIFFPRNDGHSALALMYYHLFYHEWVTTNPIWVCKHPINRSSKYLFWSKTKQASNMILPLIHYNDIMMCATASQITSLTIVYSTVYSDADQRKHQSSASLGPLNSPHKWPVTRKIFPFDDVIMYRKATWLLDFSTQMEKVEVMPWKRFRYNWPIVRGIYGWHVNFLHKIR